MEDQTGIATQTVDPYKHLRIVPNQEGTITRLRVDTLISPSSDPNLPVSVLTKDIIITQPFDTFIRIFLPRKALDNCSSSGNNKLPLILYFHGGGFILFSAASSIFHDFCTNMANDVQAVVASIEYRLAPEHRLPAAYDDAMQALHWIKTNRDDDWLGQYADYSSCYLMGSSSGANIAYHAGLRAAAEAEHLQPLKIRGLILVQPFLGGSKRCGSELRLVNDSVLPPCVSDLMWELSLPIGVDRDHEYCNPTVAREAGKMMEKIGGVGWRVLVSGCDGDPLVDRQRELVKWMKEKGVEVESSFDAGYNHGVEIRDPLKQKQLFGMIRSFVGSLLRASENGI